MLKQMTIGGVARASALAGLALVVGVLSALPVTASAAPAWSVLKSPNPSVPQGALVGLSCVSSVACTAVGEDVSTQAGADVTLAEAWNGKKWAIEPTASPAGVEASYFTAVSCSAATVCTAVGYDSSGSGADVTLAEAWNGKKWAIEPTPNATRATASDLYGVSCATAMACTTVGDYTDNAGTDVMLAEAWNGKKWAIVATPTLAGAQRSSLNDVSCTAATACTAVGSFTNGSGATRALALAWNGRRWLIAPTAVPTGSQGSSLDAVSCTAATTCTAVGSYSNRAGARVTLAEARNGKNWAIEPIPDTSGAQRSSLYGVSCTAATTCTAVGAYTNSAGTDVALAEIRNGKKWASEPIVDPAGSQGSSLDGASCNAATACTAVGTYTNAAEIDVTLAEVWSGKKQLIEPTPNPTGATPSSLSGVSCTEVRVCTAVGTYTDSAGTEVTLAEAWNGKRWVIEPTSDPIGAIASSLDGVSCTSASACTAVGSYTDSAGTDRTLAEAWNGTKWAIEPTPNRTGTTASSLDAVSCTSASACAAVGSYTVAGGTDVTLAEEWNGRKWTIELTPNPTLAIASYLYAVSCTSASACTAVGSYSIGAATDLLLAEVWNGASWAMELTPPPVGSTSSYLYGVSCTSSTSCTAVGNFTNSVGTDVTLAEVWNGTSWAMASTPNSIGAQGSYLFGLSCISASACTAVGDYSNSAGGDVTLAEAWNGTLWAIAPTPNPPGALVSYLSGVSCIAATCNATGYYYGRANISATLVERSS
jgi:hypothetical protein